MQAELFRVTGRVQGVGFRMFVQSTARRLQLRGWVRNLPDGSVECAAAGSADELRQLESELRRGPPLSRVEAVHSSPCPERPGPGFEIR